MKQDPLWGGKKLPENKWIGMKYILANINNDSNVRLRMYIDSISNGNPVNGGEWQLVGDITDNGTNWQGADISGCSYTNNFMPIISGGNVILRTDNDTAQYKMVSVREIVQPETTNVSILKQDNKFNILVTQKQLKVITNEKILQIEILSISGQVLNVLKASNNIVNISSLSPGVYILRAFTSNFVLTRKFIF